MRFLIEPVDLVANAFIAALKDRGQRFLSFQQIEAYGERVINVLKDSNDTAVLNLSRDKTGEMFEFFSRFFRAETREGCSGVRLVDGVTSGDLIREFRGYLPLNLLLAFADERACQGVGGVEEVG